MNNSTGDIFEKSSTHMLNKSDGRLRGYLYCKHYHVHVLELGIRIIGTKFWL